MSQFAERIKMCSPGNIVLETIPEDMLGESVEEIEALARGITEKFMEEHHGSGQGVPTLCEISLHILRSGLWELNKTKALWLRLVAHHLDETSPYCLMGVSTGCSERGDPLSALKYAQRALEVGPGLAGTNHLVGVCLQNMGRHKEAIPYLETALRITVDYPDREEAKNLLDTERRFGYL